MNLAKLLRRCAVFGLAVPFLFSWLLMGSPAAPTARFEVYCDGLGIFLSNVDGAPAPGKLVLFSYVDFPPGTVGGRYLRQGQWSDLIVYGGGCVPDGKCESIAHGKVWIDEWNTSNTAEPHPKHISGKYEIDISGKQLKGSFVADERTRRITRRLCM